MLVLFIYLLLSLTKRNINSWKEQKCWKNQRNNWISQNHQSFSWKAANQYNDGGFSNNGIDLQGCYCEWQWLFICRTRSFSLCWFVVVIIYRKRFNLRRRSCSEIERQWKKEENHTIGSFWLPLVQKIQSFDYWWSSDNISILVSFRHCEYLSQILQFLAPFVFRNRKAMKKRKKLIPLGVSCSRWFKRFSHLTFWYFGIMFARRRWV